MTAPAGVKAELLALIDGMSPEAAADLLDYINMRADPDELSPEEAEAVRTATAEFERGETLSGEALKRELRIGL